MFADGREVPTSPNKARYVYGRPRDGETAVSRENEAGCPFQHLAMRFLHAEQAMSRSFL